MNELWDKKYEEQLKYCKMLNKFYGLVKNSPLNKEKMLRDNGNFTENDYIYFDIEKDCFMMKEKKQNKEDTP
jgi:hypothetical protein